MDVYEKIIRMNKGVSTHTTEDLESWEGLLISWVRWQRAFEVEGTA